MRSLRSRLFALWILLAATGSATGILLYEFYRQSANVQVGRAEELISRACRELSDRVALFATDANGHPSDRVSVELSRQFASVLQGVLAHAPGVEGGIWRSSEGSLAYAFPTYEGTGPKTDVPVAELSTIREVNAAALRSGHPMTIRQTGRSQVLAVHACPLRGTLTDSTAWTMTRVFTGEGPSYNLLMTGLTLLVIMVLGSAAWLGRILYAWSRNVGRIEAALAAGEATRGDLPSLPLTQDRELDRLVIALNATGARLSEERRRASAAEQLAAVGRLAAGLAHEIRNPIAAMRLKAENALAINNEERRASALRAILEQIGRLDALLRDLLAMTQRRELKPGPTQLKSFLERTAEAHRELAVSKGVELIVQPSSQPSAIFDEDQMRRALDNLILNAIENTPPGGTIEIAAERTMDHLQLRVCDSGRGVPESIRETLFEPFVTGRPEGTGLGLATVRDIARAHGGEAKYVQTQHGSLFEIDVPWQMS